MQKHILRAVIVLIILTGVFACTSAVFAADNGFVPAVRVVCEGTVKAEFSEAQLRAIDSGSVYTYSCANHMGNSRIYKGQGPAVLQLIEQAGIDLDKIPANRIISIKGVDGYGIRITKGQLTEPRYSYQQETGQASTVPAILDISPRGEGTLCIGQAAPGEQNYPAFVSYVAYKDDNGSTGEINITSDIAEKALDPAAMGSSKTIEWGSSVRFSLNGFGKWDKIYYTTDGSAPKLSSDIYNYNTFSTPVVCREITVPAGVSTFTVKAFTAAFGKADSSVASYKYKVIPPAVKGVKASAASKSAKLSWKKISKTDGYYIYRATKKTGSYKKIASVKGSKTTSCKDKTVKKGKTYYYKIRAYSGKSKGSFSKPVKVRAK